MDNIPDSVVSHKCMQKTNFLSKLLSGLKNNIILSVSLILVQNHYRSIEILVNIVPCRLPFELLKGCPAKLPCVAMLILLELNRTDCLSGQLRNNWHI